MFDPDLNCAEDQRGEHLALLNTTSEVPVGSYHSQHHVQVVLQNGKGLLSV